MSASTTTFTTADGLTVYDLDPQASELWVIAGPPGLDVSTIDPDALPEGCRWVEDDEWAAILATVAAFWSGDQYIARPGGREEWRSIDGDTWTDAHGADVDTARFHAASILLRGGPRDGVTVR